MDPISHAVQRAACREPDRSAKKQALDSIAAAGLVVRLMDDETDHVVLMSLDLRGDRITIHIRDGVVTEAKAG